jgi:GTP-binding protein
LSKNSSDLFDSCKFIAAAATLEQIPTDFRIPETAFIGRSNVGKSSLINAIVGKQNCARVSKTPGRTRQINFFSLQNKMLLSDLPGYGYAVVSKETRKSWDNLIINYLRGRQNLRRVFLLIDSRHGIKENDEEIMCILDKAAVVYQIILTKIDKNPAHDVEKQIASKISNHTAMFPFFISTSVQKKQGIQEIRAEIIGLI